MQSCRQSRSSRQARVNYAQLAGGLVLENDNPNTVAHRKTQRSKQGSQATASAVAQSKTSKYQQHKRSKQPNKLTPTLDQQASAIDGASARHPAQLPQSREPPGDCGQPSDVLQPKKRKRQRTVVGSLDTSEPSLHPEDCENDYERARLERIRRNKEVLEGLGINRIAQTLVHSCHQGQQQGGAEARGARPARPKERQRAPPLPPQPARKSARMRGLDPSSASAEAGAGCSVAALDQDPEEVGLLSLREYFQQLGQDVGGALVVDGRYHGWVNPEVCQRYGVAGSADEAWESNGGGKFTFKIDKKAIPAHLRSKGWSDARAFASTQLQKNPNSFFYRHVAPHEQQAQGEWTEEEHELFLSTARANGVGDKWGLFASYIPQRVGYQCSAYYRDVIIPSGVIIDDRFKITRNGRAIFKG